MVPAAKELGRELGFITCSIYVNQAFHIVLPLNLSFMKKKEMSVVPIFCWCNLERANWTAGICVTLASVSGIPLTSPSRGGRKAHAFAI